MKFLRKTHTACSKLLVKIKTEEEDVFTIYLTDVISNWNFNVFYKYLASSTSDLAHNVSEAPDPGDIKRKLLHVS